MATPHPKISSIRLTFLRSSIHPHLKPLQTDIQPTGEEAEKPDEFIGAGVALGGLFLPAYEKVARGLVEEVLHLPEVELYIYIAYKHEKECLILKNKRHFWYSDNDGIKSNSSK
jgi:hypothetical protein